jgi:hypothetical protein
MIAKDRIKLELYRNPGCLPVTSGAIDTSILDYVADLSMTLCATYCNNSRYPDILPAQVFGGPPSLTDLSAYISPYIYIQVNDFTGKLDLGPNLSGGVEIANKITSELERLYLDATCEYSTPPELSYDNVFGSLQSYDFPTISDFTRFIITTNGKGKNQLIKINYHVDAYDVSEKLGLTPRSGADVFRGSLQNPLLDIICVRVAQRLALTWNKIYKSDDSVTLMDFMAYDNVLTPGEQKALQNFRKLKCA